MANAQKSGGNTGNETILWRVVDGDGRAFFLNELRQARHAAQKDAEAFDHLLFVFERLGLYLHRQPGSLGEYETALLSFAEQSGLGRYLSQRDTIWHSPLRILYKMVRCARNDALHQGAAVRHLTQHTIELALFFEDALMNGKLPMETLRDIMVRCPIIAEDWQPISFVRQVMLTNSFSFLPILWGGKWKVLSDVQVASFLRGPATTAGDRHQRLGMTVREAALLEPNGLLVEVAPVEPCNKEIEKILGILSHKPILVCESDGASANGISDRLVGIVTAFDIL